MLPTLRIPGGSQIPLGFQRARADTRLLLLGVHLHVGTRRIFGGEVRAGEDDRDKHDPLGGAELADPTGGFPSLRVRHSGEAGDGSAGCKYREGFGN